MEFQSWIREKIDDYIELGHTETELAMKIGINQGTLNAWKNGTRPAPIRKDLKEKLVSYYRDSDPRVYDVLGVPREKPTLFSEFVMSVWDKLSPEAQKKIIAIIEEDEGVDENIARRFESVIFSEKS